jgi:hypothetical protein
VHYILPAALYAASRNLFLSLWLVWAWESVEHVLALGFPSLAETWYDSLLGDPLQGSLSIASMYLADAVWLWGESVVARVPLALRLLHFGIVAVTSFGANSFAGASLRVGVLAYGALYVGSALLIYGANDDVAAWLVTVGAVTLVATPTIEPLRSNALSVFSRVLFSGMLAFFVLMVAMAVHF